MRPCRTLLNWEKVSDSHARVFFAVDGEGKGSVAILRDKVSNWVRAWAPGAAVAHDVNPKRFRKDGLRGVSSTVVVPIDCVENCTTQTGVSHG